MEPVMTLRIHRKFGLRDLDLFGDGDHWFAAVDGALLRGRFTSQADAQAAGIAELEGSRCDEASSRPASIIDPNPSL
jgi:hypothetical protein